MIRSRTLGLALAGAVVGVLLAAGLMLSQVSAQDEAVSIGRATVGAEGQASVTLEALNIGAPGLGAWTIDVLYDPEVVTPLECSPHPSSFCNPSFAADTVRVIGASGNGLAGDTTLATITFRCESEGVSALTLSVRVLADATPGDLQDISANTEHGNVACIAASVAPTATPPAPAPTEAPPLARANCEPSYPDVCLLIGTDYDCVGGPGEGPNFVQGPILVFPPDPYNLDADGDGIGCTTFTSGVLGTSRAPGLPVAGGPTGSNGSAWSWIIVLLVGAGLAWLTAGLAGVGLASASGSGAPPARGREQPSGATAAVAFGTAGFLPKMRPVGSRLPRPGLQDRIRLEPRRLFRYLRHERRRLTLDERP